LKLKSNIPLEAGRAHPLNIFFRILKLQVTNSQYDDFKLMWVVSAKCRKHKPQK